MSSDTDWRWADAKGQQRLVRTDELRAALANGVIASNAPVWRRGWKGWKPAHDVPELVSSALSAANGVVPNIPPPPLFIVAVQAEFEGPSSASQSSDEEPPPPPAYVPTPRKKAAAMVAQAAKADAEAAPAPSKNRQTVLGIAPPANSPFSAEAKPPAPASREAPETPAARPPSPMSSVPTPPPSMSSPPASLSAKDLDAKKRATLILHGGAPSSDLLEDSSPTSPDAPPIVVPAPGSGMRNAVTRPPPWDDGAVDIGPPMPKGAQTPRERAESIDFSDSMLIEDPPTPPPVPAPSVRRPPSEATSAREPHESLEDAPPSSTMEEVPLTAVSPGGIPSNAEKATPRPHAMQRRTVLFLAGGAALVCIIAVVAMLRADCTDVAPGSDRESSLTASATDDRARKNLATNSANADPSPLGSPAGIPGAQANALPAVPSSTPPNPSDAVVASPCSLQGEPRKVAAHALVGGGIEASPLANGVAVGYVVGPKEGAVSLLSFNTLASMAPPVRVRSADLLRRVTPLIEGGKSRGGAGDVDRKNDRLVGRRTFPGGPPIDVGVHDGYLAWAAHNGNKTSPLWPLAGAGAGEGTLDALRGVPFVSAKGYAVAFRRGSNVYVGTMTGDRSSFQPKGDLVRVPGLGPQIGAPSIAASGDVALAVWADHAPGASWGVRMLRLPMGDASASPQWFTPPPGGLGAPFMSPTVTPLNGGRFLLVWTEGPAKIHQVRAQVLQADGSVEGGALTVSPENVNAGQAIASLGDNGKGAVAYLVSGR